MPSDTFAAGIEAALATVPAGWSWSVGQMMGLPDERRYRCFLSDHNSTDKIARIHCDHDDTTPVAAILGAVEKVYRLWPDTPRALTPTASEATAIGAGEGLSARALHWRLMGLAASLRSDQFDEDDASARDIEEAARRLAAASPKAASDTAISGLNPKPGHSEGCGAHDDYACDCGKVASDTAPGAGVRS